MSARAWYAAGSGLLVGQGDHWLLIGVEPPDALVDALWQTVTAPGPGTSRALTDLIAAHYGNDMPPLVIVDTSPGAAPPVLRGGGQIGGDAAYHLSVGCEANGGLRPFGGGVVPAGLAEIRPDLQAAGPASEAPVIPGIIDGIPPEILAASSSVPPRTGFQRPTFTADPPIDEPTRVVAPSAGFETVAERPPQPAEQASTVRRDDQRSPTVARPERHQLDHDGSTVGIHVPGSAGFETVAERPPQPAEHASDLDHDGMTTYRPEASTGGFETVAERPPQPAEAIDHLSHNTRETVLAVHCPRGHVTPAYTPNCRTCNSPVPPQDPQRLPRPRLGGLLLPTGETVPLDRGVVFGRKPAPMPGGEEWPHLVYLPQDSSYLSRMHLAIELDGWLVMAQDLGARGGTTLKVPGRPPEKLRAGETYVLESGHALDLADVYEIVFEVNAQ